jgi:outer membrane lipoprotein LolB
MFASLTFCSLKPISLALYQLLTHRFVKLLMACVCLAYMATGCASLEPVRQPTNDAALQTVERWQGRFSAVIESAADQAMGGEGTATGSTSTSPKRESVTGRFELSVTETKAKQSDNQAAETSATKIGNVTVLELSSPLGQLLARLSLAHGKARLETADRGDFTAPDMDSLTDSVLGWRVPVQRMSIWLQGKATENSVVDAQGKLISAIDGGWTLVIDEHNAQGKPSKLTLNNNAGGQNVSGISKVRLRLLID